MNAEIISVGAELIAGDVSNTNASYLSQQLAKIGIQVTRQTAVDDKPESITEALAAAVARSPVILFTGGLGPTADDMTKEVVCAAVGMELVEHPESMKRLTRAFAAKDQPMPPANRKQALFPAGAVVFPNPVGTADGCAIESGNQCIVMLPGPPRELRAMFENSVEDYLQTKTDSTVVSRTLKVFGMGESKVAEQLGDLLAGDDPRVATYLGQGDLRIKITSVGQDRAACEQRCRMREAEIAARLGSCVYAAENVTLQQTVVSLLKKAGKRIATAESCTAGMLSEMLTDVSGASEVFEFGVSAYANRVKHEVLGVPDSLLKTYGAVSPQVAEAMAKGAAQKGKADLGIGITGMAGPTGGSEEKPVGLVYISLFDGTRCFTRRLRCNPDSPREKIRLSAAMNALDMVRLYLREDPAFLAKGQSPDPLKARRRWWQTILPQKGDSPAEITRKIIMMICLLVCIGSLIYIADYYLQSWLAKRNNQEISGIFHQEMSINERFKALLAVNPDTVGWLTVPGTQCDNPVVKTTNNEKYLDTTFEGKKSKYGTLFADSKNTFTAEEGLSDNTVIYGHHMRDGTMFGELKRLRDYDFYKKHPTVQFTWLYDTETVEWKILSVFIVNTEKADAEDTVFPYRHLAFTTEQSFLQYVDECRQRSLINTGVDAVYGDKLLTLSTCTYEFDDARLVVLARRVRPGEDPAVDLTKTSENDDPVFPKAYYKKTGSSGRTSVRSYTYTASKQASSKAAPSKASSAASKPRSSTPTSSIVWSNTGSIDPSMTSINENPWDSNFDGPSVESPPDSESPPVSSQPPESSVPSDTTSVAPPPSEAEPPASSAEESAESVDSAPGGGEDQPESKTA